MAPKIKAPIFGTVDRGKVGAEVPYSDLIPETYFRNSLDLNRFENKVSKELIQSYNRIIIDSVRKLEAIERLPKANQPKYTAARLRSLLAQTKKSLEGWSNSSSRELIKDLDGIAKLQSEFVEEQLKKVLPAGMRSSVRSVEVSPKFAEAVVRNKATDINANVLSDDLQAAVKGVDGLRKAQGSFNLTAKMGSKITLPNGDIVSKAFRGLAEKNADLFGRTIRDGLLSGETTQQVGRRLLGQLYFGEKARTAKQLALAGGEATRMANHQISTLVRTSIQQVSDTAAQSVYKQNSDITQSYKWLATLDSRTAPQCMALDQKVFKYGQGPTPPQHFNCRCRTVATIDYEGLDIPPPNFTRSTRAAVGGPVPTGTSYGSWLQKQPPQMRAKILGGKEVTLASGKKVWRGKFQYFDKLSKKVGPDQAIAKFVSSDGSEKSLKQLQKTYGKPSNIKPKVKPIAKPAPATAVDMSTYEVDRWLKDNKAAPNIQKFVDDSLDTWEKQGGLIGENTKKMRQFMKQSKMIRHFNMPGERANFEQIKSKFLSGKNLKAYKDQLKTVETRFDKYLNVEKTSKEYAESRFYWLRNKKILQKAEGFEFEKMCKRHLFGNAGGTNTGFTSIDSNIIHTKIPQTAKKIGATQAKQIKKTSKAALDNNALMHTKDWDYMMKHNLKETWSASGSLTDETDWFATMIHEAGHQVHFQGGAEKLGRQWMKLKGMTYTGEYSRKNYLEQFAEAFTQYVLNPDGLKEHAPRLYNWVDLTMDNALKPLNL